ncbi:hypothetical protein NXS19_008642 [Fusarium pseudograminearum]|nr:hypothetical protein NXS19_008642 [Fusarium pseudograminearum]
MTRSSTQTENGWLLFFGLGAGANQLRSKTDGLSGPLIALGVLRNGSPELALDARLLNRHTPLVCTHHSSSSSSSPIIKVSRTKRHGIILTGLSFLGLAQLG